MKVLMQSGKTLFAVPGGNMILLKQKNTLKYLVYQ